jgi:hypothetical protein
MSERDYFLKARKEFEEKHEFIVRIFRGVGRQNVEPRRAWANLLFFRLCMVGNTLLTLCIPEILNRKGGSTDISVLDHSSIATLARNLLETWMMFSYVSEPTISEEEWLRRRAVLELHDVTARYRVLKAIGDRQTKEAQLFRDKMSTLRKTIASDPIFQSLDTKSKDDIREGRSPFIYGRNAVVREAGWDVDHFTAMYAALSSHAHCGSASFYRAALHPDEPAPGIASDYQYMVSGLAFEYATEPLGFACERMFHLYPKIFLADETKH